MVKKIYIKLLNTLHFRNDALEYFGKALAMTQLNKILLKTKLLCPHFTYKSKFLSFAPGNIFEMIDNQ